ncbi:MAG: ABC transporter substrate-binding protein [Chloroflexaceae bacterium]|nr:ABC transporter substrate-binding protein [Chloroflexaceae bacterium]
MLALLLLLLSACGGAPATPPASAPLEEAAPEPVTVRMGYVPVIIFAPMYVAIERGYFAEEGITVELTSFQSTNDAVVQLGAGNSDVAIAGANAGLFNAIARGLDLTIVAPMHSERPPLATPLIISANRVDELTSIADLRGGTLGVNGNGSAIEYWLAQALAQGGVGIDEVTIQAVPFPAMPAALENGTLDAAVMSEPLVTINQDQGLIAVLSDDYLDGFTATYVIMHQAWLDANPDAARRFLRAYLRACQDLQGDYMTPEIAAIIEQYTEVPAPVIERSNLSYYQPDGTIPLQDIATLQTFFLERGVLEYNEALDVNSFVNTTLVTEVAGELIGE